MTQMLLFADPRPLVERLGREFFRRAPLGPGVYLMRDAAGAVLYVGKAKNLRKRLASYRVANPDRLGRRHLRLLRAVAAVEFQECADESSALAKESELLLALRPRFNRAGTWPASPRYLGWRLTEAGLEFAVMAQVKTGWVCHGPMDTGANRLRAVLVRLLWCALHPSRGLAGMPQGWFGGRLEETVTLPPPESAPAELLEAEVRVQALLAGDAEKFSGWIRERTAAQIHPFELAIREADLESVSE